MVPQIEIIDIILLNRTNFHFKTENKACHVLTCRIEGESLFFYNQKEHLIERGDILYIPSGASYSQVCERETIICFHLNISGDVSQRMEAYLMTERNKICDLFIKAEHLWKQKGFNYELKCMSIVYEIISNIQICETTQSRGHSSLLNSAMLYLDAHIFDADFSLERLCHEVHISQTYLNLLFQKNYHCTPIEYIHRQRINRAKQLLLVSTFSNEEIAKLCGFREVKYFYVIFKKQTGLTTKEYLKHRDIALKQ